MALARKASFSAGELDPALHERTNLDKYQSGLSTLRNAYIGKTGRVISRPGTRFILATKYPNKKSVLTAPPFEPYLVEWGHEYVRIHTITYDSGGVALVGLYTEEAHDWLESDLPNIQFFYSGRFMYALCEGKRFKKMVIGNLDISDPRLTNRFVSDSLLTNLPVAKTLSSPVNTGAGYPVDYVATYVLKGEESLISNKISDQLPITAGTANTLRLAWGTSAPSNVSEVKFYRRPTGGNAYGYIGSSSEVTFSSPNYYFDFEDVGGDADYTNSPPTVDFDALNANPKTGTVYQQRLILSEETNKEGIHASRPGLQNNFTRDYPLDSDSALTFKSGTSGNANVLRMLDAGPFLAFTTAGIFGNSGALTPENLAMDKKGNWVIDESVPPLEIPGGLLFVDKLTNTVRSLIFSNEAGGYPGDEISIFSNHMFLNKKIVSWAFQDGDTPLVWVVFDDGSMSALTYQREHEMQAWSRHDSSTGKYESTAVVKDTSAKGTAFFIVERDGIRIIEATTDRSIEHVREFCGVDAALTWSRNLNALAAGATFNVYPEDAEDWGGILLLTSDFAAFDSGDVGDIYRHFDTQGAYVDLEVVTYLSSVQVRVQVLDDGEFPKDQSKKIQLWLTSTTFGEAGYGYNQLNHLLNKKVSILCDGEVLASPNNDIDNYEDVIITGPTYTLPDGKRAAFIHIGIPFTSDMETLDIDTVEQKPILIEDKIVNKVYVKVYKTRGIYVGYKFPDNDSLLDEAGNAMEDPEERDEEVDVGNAPQALVTKRYDITVPNSWGSNGRVCIRQVDPLPFEILSVFPEITTS